MGYYEKPIPVSGMPDGLFLIELDARSTSGAHDPAERLRVIVDAPVGGTGLAQRWSSESGWSIWANRCSLRTKPLILAAIDAIEAAGIPWEHSNPPQYTAGALKSIR